MMRPLLFALLLSSCASPALAQDSTSYLTWPPNSSLLATDVIQYATPTNGSTTVINIGATALVLDNASLLATATVTLPASPVDGQRVVICSGAGVTLLTLNGGTIKGTMASLAVNGYARFIYSASANSGAGAWFRTG